MLRKDCNLLMIWQSETMIKGDVTLTEMLKFQSDSIEILLKFNTMVWNVVALSSVKSGPTFQT